MSYGCIVRSALVLLAAVAMVVGMACGVGAASTTTQVADGSEFAPIYRVLTSPRCLNCHTATVFPRQGNERRVHDFKVSRGSDDHGAAGMRCATCHTNKNFGATPGAPRWSLAPLSMAWEDLSPVQLCERLKDPQRNGQRSIAQLVDHMQNDPLVAWGWAPGAGRSPVPMPKDEFVQALNVWAEHAAPCPQPAVASLAAAKVSAPGYELRELRGGLYWLSDGAYNTMFLVSTGGVIAIDPLPTLGPRYMQAIRSVTNLPVTHIIYSHEHTDHIGGASLFPKGAQIIAQQETAQALARTADPRRPVPTITFANDYTLTVGDQTLQLSYKSINHSVGNVFIYAPRQKVLMLVDVVYPGYMPYPQLGVAADIPGYVQAHRDALAYDFTDFVGGHVDRLGTRADVETSLAFAQDVLATARHSVDDLSFPQYLKQQPQPGLQTWFAHDEYEKNRVAACYSSLLSRWESRMQGADRFLASHCWSVIVGLAISLPP